MIESLLEYQKVDSELRGIELEISKSEERKKYAVAKRFLDGVNTNLSMLDGKSEDLYNKYNSLKSSYQQLKDNSAEYDSIIENCEDNGELNYIAKKAQELADKLAELEKNLEKIGAEINGVVREFNKLAKDTKDMKAQYAEFGPKYRALKQSKEAQMNAIKERLAKIEVKVNPELMEKYKQKRQDKIFPILFPMNGKHCSYCGTELSMIEYNNLEKKGIIECDNCRKLVYLESSIK